MELLALGILVIAGYAVVGVAAEVLRGRRERQNRSAHQADVEPVPMGHPPMIAISQAQGRIRWASYDPRMPADLCEELESIDRRLSQAYLALAGAMPAEAVKIDRIPT